MARKPYSGITELYKASLHRMADAEVLFAGRRWRGAMYVAGYAVECRLKYKLMRQWKCFNLEELGARLVGRGVVETVFTHNLEALIQICGGWNRLRANDDMWRAYGVVSSWQPAWRYNADLASHRDARRLLAAAQQVLEWIENNL